LKIFEEKYSFYKNDSLKENFEQLNPVLAIAFPLTSLRIGELFRSQFRLETVV